MDVPSQIGAINTLNNAVADIEGLDLFIWAPLNKAVKAGEINWNNLAANDGKYHNEAFLEVLKNEISHMSGGSRITTVPLKWNADKKSKSVAFKFLIRLMRDADLVGQGNPANIGRVPYRVDFGHYYAGSRAALRGCW